MPNEPVFSEPSNLRQGAGLLKEVSRAGNNHELLRAADLGRLRPYLRVVENARDERLRPAPSKARFIPPEFLSATPEEQFARIWTKHDRVKAAAWLEDFVTETSWTGTRIKRTC
jgi:hypothetical protein